MRCYTRRRAEANLPLRILSFPGAREGFSHTFNALYQSAVPGLAAGGNRPPPRTGWRLQIAVGVGNPTADTDRDSDPRHEMAPCRRAKQSGYS